MTEYITTSEREGILGAGVVTGEFTLASGVHVREKFDFDLIESHSDEFQCAVRGLVRLVNSNFAGYGSIITVGNGATRLGAPLAQRLKVPHIAARYTDDDEGTRHFTMANPHEKRSGVIIDDVFTQGTRATAVAEASAEIGIETIGLAVILDRSGQPRPRIQKTKRVVSLIQQELS